MCSTSISVCANGGPTDGSGNFRPVIFSNSRLSLGVHCVSVVPYQVGNFGSVTVVSAAIPEYPIGLPALAIFMDLAYAVIKRKTLTKN